MAVRRRILRLRVERRLSSRESIKASWSAISPDSFLRAERSWGNVVIPENSFVSIEDIDEEFHENIYKESLPDQKNRNKSNKKDAADDECRSSPASDQVSQ